MTTIRVCRNPNFPGECRSDDTALNWGDDISNVLLTEESAALERGRIEIDRQYTNRISSNLSLYRTTFIQPGKLIATQNLSKIETGKVKHISIKVAKTEGSISVGSEITMEKNV
jgi:hypothetical protein